MKPAVDRTPLEGIKHHGTVYSYSKLGCPCIQCLNAYHNHRVRNNYIERERELRRERRKTKALAEFDVTRYWSALMSRIYQEALGAAVEMPTQKSLVQTSLE